MTGYIVAYLLGVSTVVVPLGYLYAKGFFDAWVKKPVVTISDAGVSVSPEVKVDGGV